MNSRDFFLHLQRAKEKVHKRLQAGEQLNLRLNILSELIKEQQPDENSRPATRPAR